MIVGQPEKKLCFFLRGGGDPGGFGGENNCFRILPRGVTKSWATQARAKFTKKRFRPKGIGYQGPVFPPFGQQVGPRTNDNAANKAMAKKIPRVEGETNEKIMRRGPSLPRGGP